MTDEIRLSLPAQEDFHHVAHLVVGGLAARRDLTYDFLEDMQVAYDALLACRDDEGEIVLTMCVDNGELRSTIGPFADASLRHFDDGATGLPLRRVLETVCDAVAVESKDGAQWVELKKRVA